jgi:hypothetical protein
MTHRIVVVALLGVLSCKDSSGPNTLGSLSFSFTGGGGGTYSASGAAPSFSAPPPTATSWATGFVDGAETFIAASRPRSGVLVDLVLLRFGLTTTGTETIDPACNIDGTPACNGMDLSLNFNGNGDTADFFCSLTSGTIVVTSVSGGRAQGTFSGNGQCQPGTGGAPSAFSVSNGTFDVALVAPPS